MKTKPKTSRRMKVSMDAVELQRSMRDELSRLYNTDPEGFMKKLEDVRKKYRRLFKTRKTKR